MRDDVENTNRSLAAVFTVVFHGILFLIIFFVVFKTPLPPYPEVGGGSGLEVNFGNTDKGFGDNKSEQLIDVQTQQLSASSEDNNITQDNEETTSLSSTHKKPTKTKPVIKINDPVVDNSNKLYSKRNKSQGTAGGNGNEGKLNGDPNSSNYTGSGGSGGGNDGGNGHGHGPGNGDGTSYNLANRTNLYLPKPEYNSDDQGIVIVTITVDQTGKVTKAKAGAKGTTVTDKALWKQSEQAAYRAKFNKKKDAAIEQIGTITYHFLKLN